MRILFTSTIGLGHLLPSLSLATAAGEAGHEIRVATAAEHAERIMARGLGFVALPQPSDEQFAAVRAAITDEIAAAVQIFGRLRPMAAIRTVAATAADWPADLIVSEGAEPAGSLAAEQLGLPSARIHPGMVHGGAWEELLATVLSDVRAELGLPRDDVVGRLFALPHVSYFPAELDRLPLPRDVLRVRRPGLPTARTDRERLIYITFGSEVPQTPMFAATARAAIHAARQTGYAVILSVGGADPAELGDLTGIEVNSWVDQTEVLPRAAVMISHGGAGTTLDAIAAGAPTITIPFFADQPFNADALAAAGAGLTVHPGPKLAERLSAALQAVLTATPPGCRRLADAVAALPSIAVAVDALEREASFGSRSPGRLALA